MDVLTNFLNHGDVVTNLWGRFDQFGDVLTRGRFDCNPPGKCQGFCTSSQTGQCNAKQQTAGGKLLWYYQLAVPAGWGL